MRRCASILAAIAATGVATCSCAPDGPAPTRRLEVVRDPAPRSIPLDDRAVAALRAAERCVLGRIDEVGPSPGVWSGIVATYQPVVLRVERRLDAPGRGWPQPGDRFAVWFGIVGPPDTLPDEPRLDPRIHRIGARGVVGVEFGPPVLGDASLRDTAVARAVTSFHEIDDDRDLDALTSGR